MLFQASCFACGHTECQCVSRVKEIVQEAIGSGELLILECGRIRIEVRASPEEMAWLRPLFTRYPDPFRALRDMGYEAATSGTTA
jgi:hypothetical protein